MPVSTRSQIFGGQDDPNQNQRTCSGADQEESQLGTSLSRNPHHRLKEKMKALTLLYEQQKQQQEEKNALKNSFCEAQDRRLSTHQQRGEETNESKPEFVMKENKFPNPLISKRSVLPIVSVADDDAKENLVDFSHQVGFSCPNKQTTVASTVSRKLSMGNLGPQSEGRSRRKLKLGGELETISENCAAGSRILVFVRLRPMAKKEKEAGSRCCIRIVNRREVYLTEFATENDYLRLKRLRGRHFTFDASFPDSTTQHEVYSTSTSDLVEAVLQGRNGSVFCYGATGAGKTYTMLGTLVNPGVMVLAIKDLFSKIRQRSCDGNHVVHLSYLEVYNETVRDLLSPGRPLVLREDKQGIVAAGLTQYRAYSTDEVMALLQQGNLNRTTEPTRANETSSRSHAILQVVVEYRVRDSTGNIVNRVGKLSLIDLAGSERALATDQRTLRSLEGANINRSLLALSSCINALVEGKKHIPYRNSKLTQLLKDSLGGICNTVMIANISPSNLSFGETQNTLHWADRAKEIRTKAGSANEELMKVPESETDQAKLLLEVQKENRDLRQQLARQQQKLLTIQAQSLAANSSPTPSSVSSLLSPPCSTQLNEKCRSKISLLSGNCFNTPGSKKRGGAEETVRELRQMVKALETEIERLKKEHGIQIKEKEDLILELSRNDVQSLRGEGLKSVTRARPKEVVERTRIKGDKSSSAAGDLKSPSHRFLSPAPTAKKRTFWDITAATSPSVTAVNTRKTKNHVATDPATTHAAPSMLLQPGFARQRFDHPGRR